ncbi:DUF2145 domain-containing protein [Ideonella sp. 4Y11]|uniref:DUF2145 domain-containing protein n=1 Tax=Ideonella aquatica TaxID=2824119 RepID=A0A941BK11_9BURK|nr:DUF2145 domain-containing protein [Ideonella aquatica]MBQ0960042.1 DUF2145 domain-containing protein [Ideonella aquatica]
MNATWRVIALVLALLLGSGARAGRPCEPEPPTLAEVQQGLALALRTDAALQASGASVVLLARAGQDLSAYRLRWSHMGWAYRQNDASGQTVWRVVHKLNHCGSDRAQVFRQGLAEFFLDRPWRYEAALVVPAPELQARLLPLLQDDERLLRWHEPRYNMLAYPWSTRYQQSNQWALETLAGAMDDGASDRPRAQAWLQLRGYTPTVLYLGPLTRLGARATRANIAFDDHPNDKRFSDRIETTTVDSAFDWLQRTRLGDAVQVLH